MKQLFQALQNKIINQNQVQSKCSDEQRGSQKMGADIQTDQKNNEQETFIDLQSQIQDISIIERQPKILQQNNATLNNLQSTTILDDSFKSLNNQQIIDLQNQKTQQENEENLENIINFIQDDQIGNEKTVVENETSFQTSIDQNLSQKNENTLQLNASNNKRNNQNYPENIVGERQELQNYQQKQNNFNDLSQIINNQFNSQNNNYQQLNKISNSNQISNNLPEQQNSQNKIVPQSNDSLSAYKNESTIALSKQEQFEKQNNINIAPQLIKDNLFQITQVQNCIIEPQKNCVIKQIYNYFPEMYDLKQKQQNSDKNKDYYESLQEYRNSLDMIQKQITSFRDLRSRIVNVANQFLRNQSDQKEFISVKMMLSYQLSEEDLGEVFKKNRNIVEELETLEKELKSMKSKIDKDDFISKLFKLHQFYSGVFSKQLGFDVQQLEDLQTEFNSLKQECDNFEKYYNNEFSQYSNKLYENLFKLEFSELQKKNLDQRIKEIYANKNKNQEEMNTSVSELAENKKSSIQYIRKQKDEILKRIEKLKEESSSQQILKQQQVTEKISNITNQFRIGSTIEQITSFFYIILIDQSSSFSSNNAHDFAINGVIEFLQKINSKDSVAVIKFNSNIQIKQDKIKKQFLNLDQLKQNISNCEGGGTNFTVAFNQLQKILTINLEKDEYPITLLITDGQDPSDQRQIITQTKSICHDMLFFTVGYGKSINQKQLCAITDQFNDCINQTKKFQNKDVKLYLQNNTPEALKRDIISIRTQNQITIEDIKAARKFHEDSFQSYLEQRQKFDSSLNKQLENQLKQLSQKEQNLMKRQTQNQHKQMYENINKQYDEEIEQLESKKCEEIQNQQKYKGTIQQLKIDFYQKLTKNQENSSFQGVKQEFDPELLFFNVLEDNKRKNKQKTDNIQKKIDQVKSQKQIFTKEKFDEIKNLGFVSEKSFDQFNEVYQNSQTLYYDLLKQINFHIMLIQQIFSIANKLKSTINFSQNLIQTISEKDDQNRVFEFFKEYFDNSIDIRDKPGSKRKILEIQDSSILEWCKECHLEKFYESAIIKIDFDNLIEIADLKKETQSKIIQQTIVPQIIASPKYKILKKQIYACNQLIDEYKNKISELKEEIEIEESDENDKTQKLKLIGDHDNQIIKQNGKIFKLNEQLQEEQLAFEEQKSEEIDIVKKMCAVFIKAILFSSRELKYQIVTRPFKNYLGISDLAIQYLRELKE